MFNNLQQMVVLATIAKEKNFTRASEQLNISKSQVSKILKQLEVRLGCQLVQRSTRSVILTDIGKQYASFGEHLIETMDEADALAAGYSDQVKGTLRIGLAQSFGLNQITPLLQKFQTHYPDVSLEINLFDRKPNLLEERYDCWIAVHETLPEGMVARKLAECRFITVASPEYIAQHPTIRQPSDLTEHNCITYYGKRRKYEQWEFTKNDEHQSIHVHGKYRVDNAPAICEAAKLGMGVAYIATYLLNNELAENKLVQLLADWEADMPLPIYLVYPRRQFLAPKMRCFIDFMVQQIGDPLFGIIIFLNNKYYFWFLL
ncbi:LysR family transcriptional regulator [Vibrio sp. SS-MA-C1-2]|uniref:LysR family transcriptional regulator n=1 Tax=Vibrio sp. SS-MA-C1-2 TaxID=2908646 RepID=UPI001F17E944|nr:LysR family transcriptional regulator [Vibrio sp. SS-MA-C1-2]UJF17307.1 LysR family transcriptional regulator [Vibrio sp. SS-MA-C1-2]